MVLLDTETPGTSREIYSEDADGETRKDISSLNGVTTEITEVFFNLMTSYFWIS